jgi:hypothetical protein
LNYVLIFGKLGMPALGVEGAALATVISRFVECICVVVWTHLHTKECPFIIGVYRSFRIPRELVRSITVTGTPLLLNETLWAAGQAMLLQCYSLRGIATVSAMNISGIAFNTFSVLYFSMGTTIAILVGHRLGEGDLKTAASDAKKMIAFSTMLGVISGVLIASCAARIHQKRIYLLSRHTFDKLQVHLSDINTLKFLANGGQTVPRCDQITEKCTKIQHIFVHSPWRTSLDGGLIRHKISQYRRKLRHVNFSHISTPSSSIIQKLFIF